MSFEYVGGSSKGVTDKSVRIKAKNPIKMISKNFPDDSRASDINLSKDHTPDTLVWFRPLSIQAQPYATCSIVGRTKSGKRVNSFSVESETSAGLGSGPFASARLLA